jgi:hypothetical protein
LQCPRVSNIRRDVEQVLTRPPCATRRAERVVLTQKGTGEHERQGNLEEAPSEDADEASEEAENHVAGLMKDVVQRVSSMLTIRMSIGTLEGSRMDDNRVGPDVSSWKLIPMASTLANTLPSPDPTQSTVYPEATAAAPGTFTIHCLTPRRLSCETQLVEPLLQLLNRAPRPDLGIATFVRWILLELIGPASASGQRQERTMMQPRQADFRDGSRAPAKDEAGVPGESHQQIASVSHAAGNQDAAGPVLEIDVVRRDDADHQAAGGKRPLGGNPRGRTSAPANHRDAELRQQLTSGAGQFVRRRSGFCTSEHAYLPGSAARVRRNWRGR